MKQTYKVEVAFAAEAVRDESDHLMESDAAVDDHVRFGQVGHVRVHVFVHQPEGQRLVPDQRLIVALSISDVPLTVTTIGQREDDVPQVPLLV